jgi:light-regulated signal transduction histidine kinase (bacteriophytochrome)
MDAVDDIDVEAVEQCSVPAVCVQQGAYLLELSLDWIVLRASENIHHLLGESHVTLIDEPLGKFVHAQALHDLRNLFSKLSGTTGIARAYAVRLTDDPDLVDVAFQLVDGRVLLEAVLSPGSFGECFGSVGGLIAGLANSRRQALLDGGARRMRALTGYDRVTVTCGDRRAESSRGAFGGRVNPAELPILVTDTRAEAVHLFPREDQDSAAHAALLRAPEETDRRELDTQGVRAMLRIPFKAGEVSCEFCCEGRSARNPSFELHAAAELFAQMFAMQLAMDEAANRESKSTYACQLNAPALLTHS